MKEIKLFDYQEDMKERIEKALRLHRSVMAQMPTGTGKTVLLASVVESFLREHSNCNVWIVAHRRELVSQIKDTLNKFLLNFSFSNHPVPLSKEGSTFSPSPSSSGSGDVTALRCSEPLRSKVGGPSKVSPDCAEWDRLGAACLRPVEGLGDHLGMSGASKVSPDCLSVSAFNVPIKAVSIQWLSKHYDEIEEEPGMIVIDEAHHALAKTYKGMWDRFPKAKFLGLTATPCRLNGKGFTDLFDVLVQSWSVPEFISKGRLATYDFVSIKSDGVTQRLIDSLQKRGADGDYQNKEMDMLLNKKPSIERLYRSLEEYGKDRKGIVYAINISHANAIAEFYREHGIAAVAIDSKTPSSLRKELIERFKASNTSFSNHPSMVFTPPSVPLVGDGNPLSKEGNFSKITPSLFTLKEGSTSHPDPLTLRGEGGNRPTRCSEPLRSKDGGPSKVSPDCAGWDRRGVSGDTGSVSCSSGSSITSVSSAFTTDSSASTALDVVQRELKYLGLWKFAGAVMFVLHEVLGLAEDKMIVPIDEKRGRLLLAEILDGGNFGRHFTKYARFTHQSMRKKYFLKIWRNMHFVRYYPAEALCEPLFRTWHFFWRMKNKK